MALRRAAVAGTWYSANAERLSANVAAHLDHASDEGLPSVPEGAEVVAIVSPHAGLMYSGPVAAHAYRLLRSSLYDVIVLIGPSHYVSFEGASIWPEGAFETPLGNLAIDRDAATAISALCPLIHDLPAAHAQEHSLEMQLPFLAVVAAATPIVPIVMGHQTRKTAFALADALATTLAGRRAMLVASSDLSHFHNAQMAANLDRQVMAHVDALDANGLMSLLETRPDHACGGGPMVTVMRAAHALGASTASVIKYGDSGDVSGDKSSVVGYLAAAAWR